MYIVRDELYQGISTKKVYHRAFSLLSKKEVIFLERSYPKIERSRKIKALNHRNSIINDPLQVLNFKTIIEVSPILKLLF